MGTSTTPPNSTALIISRPFLNFYYYYFFWHVWPFYCESAVRARGVCSGARRRAEASAVRPAPPRPARRLERLELLT